MPAQQQQYNQYPTQPPIEEPIHEEPVDGVPSSDSKDSTTPLTSGQNELISKTSILPSRPSRSVARMAVAESAAANAFVDPLHRYQPKKPSPLALKAAEKEAAAANRARGNYLQPLDTNIEETLAGPNDYAAEADTDMQEARQRSGEWGVALGSPNTDGSFTNQQYGGPTQGSFYSIDPYLTAEPQNRAPSGQYSVDPYSAYHDGQQVDYHSMTKRGSWV